MSKGNVLLGMSRGKLGDLVLTRGAGEQIARARNRHPKNPQTTKQMAQRAALATLVEFFVRGRKNLFKFAFESKKPGESDYNAFVRANMGIVPVQSSKTLKSNNTVFGEFIMSQGSLTEPSFLFDETHSSGALVCTPLPAAGSDLTIGQLSQAIADVNGLQDGDIITIVAITGDDDVLVQTLKNAIEAKALQNEFAAQKWIIKQFKLDFSSSAKATTLGFLNVQNTEQGDEYVNLAQGAFPSLAYDDEWSVSLGVIASRVTPSGVKVSTSTLVLGDSARKSAEIGRSDEWKEWVAKNWVEASSLDVAPEDILKGSLSVN